jgi:ADP-ribose pyrophosphatase YjhB (NUDIX family)
MHKVVVKARLVLINEGKVLLLAQTSLNGGKFTLVGGTVEEKEYTKASLIREVYEEIDVIIQADDMELIHVLHKKKGAENRLTFYFTSKRWLGSIQVMEPDKFRGVAWFSIHNLPARTSPTVRHVMEQIKMGNRYSEMYKK